MKRATSPQIKIDSKTIDCITRFELIPPNLVSKDNPIFSAFSKPKFRRPYIYQPHASKNLPSDHSIQQIKPTQDNTYKSLLLNKGKEQTNVFEGLLKARKSQMKKIKLKEFYIEEYDENRHDQDKKTIQSQTSIAPIQSKNSTEFNTIDSKHSLKQQADQKKNFFIPSKKKILPVRLRAKSYSNFPKNQRNTSIDLTQDQNSLYIIKVKRSQPNHKQRSQNTTIDYDQETTQKSLKNLNCRRNLRTGKVRKISNFQEKNLKGLQDITLKMNEQSIEMRSEKDNKSLFQRGRRNRKELKSQHLSKLDSIIDINPWASNQDDKENQFFIYM